MRQAITAVAVAALLALGACGNKKDSPAAGSGSAMAAGSGSAMAAGSGSAAAIDVPTEEDFEKDATAKITDKNVEAQVQALEKELEAK
ncbi:MAG TPA: hypothetical protein VHT91_37695 [Kofleriaceae bacterium]|nr:hypothetical protein [Kofleriaceae bacterium]